MYSKAKIIELRIDRERVLQDLQRIVYEYAETKDNASQEEIQRLRDELATFTNLVGFDLLSNARAEMELAEIERKRAVAAMENEYYRDTGKDRTFANKDEAKNQAFLDCSEYYDRELEANRIYYLVNELHSNMKTFENTVASRLRLLNNE